MPIYMPAEASLGIVTPIKTPKRTFVDLSTPGEMISMVPRWIQQGTNWVSDLFQNYMHTLNKRLSSSPSSVTTERGINESHRQEAAVAIRDQSGSLKINYTIPPNLELIRKSDNTYASGSDSHGENEKVVGKNITMEFLGKNQLLDDPADPQEESESNELAEQQLTSANQGQSNVDQSAMQPIE